MRRALLLLFVALVTNLTFSERGLAAAPAARPVAPAPPAPPATPVSLPPPPTIDDPMLVPMAPAPRNLATWSETLDLVRARSTDLRIAYDEVLRAEAQSRIALAGGAPVTERNGGHHAATHHQHHPADRERETRRFVEYAAGSPPPSPTTPTERSPWFNRSSPPERGIRWGPRSAPKRPTASRSRTPNAPFSSTSPTRSSPS